MVMIRAPDRATPGAGSSPEAEEIAARNPHRRVTGSASGPFEVPDRHRTRHPPRSMETFSNPRPHLREAPPLASSLCRREAMAFRLIRGKFVVKGKQPDGDSIRFVPDNLGLLMSLRGPKPTLNPGDSVQLRLEAIDALETHYNQGRSDLDHQPDGPAKSARNFLLHALGITHVKWDAH